MKELLVPPIFFKKIIRRTETSYSKFEKLSLKELGPVSDRERLHGGAPLLCRSSWRSGQKEAQEGGTGCERWKGVCDYVGKSLLPEQARTRTHHAISSLRKNACAIVAAQVNTAEEAARLKAQHKGEMRPNWPPAPFQKVISAGQ